MIKKIQHGEVTEITESEAIEIVGSEEDFKIAKESRTFSQDDIELIFYGSTEGQF
jgi:hypothetical protein